MRLSKKQLTNDGCLERDLAHRKMAVPAFAAVHAASVCGSEVFVLRLKLLVVRGGMGPAPCPA